MARLMAACVTHRRVPVAVLERFPRGDQIPDVLHRLREVPGVQGALVLSTCNRYEVYLSVDRSLTSSALVDVLARTAQVAPGAFEAGIESYAGEDAVRHLFTVAAGLDSRALGEGEILGQLRIASQTAVREGALDAELADLVQWSVRAGRRARRTGGVRQERRSVGEEGARLVGRGLGSLAGRSVGVLGAGRVAAQVVDAVKRDGGRAVVIARDPAAALSRFPAQPVRAPSQLPDLLVELDAVVCATSAAVPVVTRSALESAVLRRRQPLLVVDLGMPRNVEPLGPEVAGVTVLDLDALPSRADRIGGLDKAQATVNDEAGAYLEARAARRAGDLLAGLTERAEQVRRDELARVHGKVTETEQALLDDVTRRLVGKLLHPALKGLRDLVAAGELTSARQVAALLDEPVVEIADPPRIAG